MNLLNLSSKVFIQGFLAICFGSFETLSSAQAVQLADGTIYFVQPPSLLQVRATQKVIRVESTYYFTLDVPADAGEPQRTGNHYLARGLQHSRTKRTSSFE